VLGLQAGVCALGCREMGCDRGELYPGQFGDFFRDSSLPLPKRPCPGEPEQGLEVGSQLVATPDAPGSRVYCLGSFSDRSIMTSRSLSG
jgi:hypothetical protein